MNELLQRAKAEVAENLGFPDWAEMESSYFSRQKIETAIQYMQESNDEVAELYAKYSREEEAYKFKHFKEIESKLISWCKNTHYSQGDGYSVRVTKKGKWAVRYTNDYPMQHGGGREFILTEQEFEEATK